MKKPKGERAPSYGQGLELDRKWLSFKSGLTQEQATMVNENFEV